MQGQIYIQHWSFLLTLRPNNFNHTNSNGKNKSADKIKQGRGSQEPIEPYTTVTTDYHPFILNIKTCD